MPTLNINNLGNAQAIGWADAAITRNAAGRVGIPALSLSQGTITAAAAIIDAAGTWNNAGVLFTAIKANITDTASNADSLLMNLQVGGVSQLTVSKSANILLSHDGNGSVIRTGASTIALRRLVGSTSAGMYLYSLGTETTQLIGRIGLGGAVQGPDCFLQTAPNILEQVNATNAQTFRLYNTFTDASNYERGFMRWSSNVLEIGTEAGGTGTLRSMRVGSSSRFRWINDGFRPKFNYAGVDIMEFGNGTFVLDDVGHLQWASADISTTDSATAVDTGIVRRIASVVGVTNGSTGGGAIGMREMTAPAAPATNDVYIYAEDNGSGKTRLMARFATGAAQQIAIEP